METQSVESFQSEVGKKIEFYCSTLLDLKHFDLYGIVNYVGLKCMCDKLWRWDLYK